MQNSGSGGRDVLGLIKAQGASASASWPAPNAVPALTRRVAELETRIRLLEAQLAEERQSRSGQLDAQRSIADALLDVRRSIEEIRAEQTQLEDQITAVRRGALDAVLHEPEIGLPQQSTRLPSTDEDPRELLSLLLAPAMENAIAKIAEPAAAVPDVGLRQIQVIISPIHTFPRLFELEQRIGALATVNAIQLHDFRDGVATFTVSLSEAISPAEFGAVLQMVQSLDLRIAGSTVSSVNLRAEDQSTAL